MQLLSLRYLIAPEWLELFPVLIIRFAETRRETSSQWALGRAQRPLEPVAAPGHRAPGALLGNVEGGRPWLAAEREAVPSSRRPRVISTERGCGWPVEKD